MIMILDSLLWAWALSPDGRVVAMVTFESAKRILGFWDIASGELLYSTSTHCGTFIVGDWYRPFDNIKGLTFSTVSSWMVFCGLPGVRVGPCGVEDS